MQAFERLQVPPAATLTDATVIRIGQLVGASQVVVGSLRLEGDALVVRARSIALETGRVQADVTERGPLPELFGTFERVARRIAPPSTKSSDEIAKMHPPVAAFENYIKGAARGNAGDRDQLPQCRAGAAALVRSRAAGAVGGLRRTGRPRAGARGRHTGGRRFALDAAGPLSRRALAAALEEARRRVRDLQGAVAKPIQRRPCSTTSGSFSCVEAARRRRASRRTTSTRPRRPILMIPTTSSISATPTAGPRSAGRDLLAARSGAPQPGRRRRALRPRRGARGRRQRQ